MPAPHIERMHQESADLGEKLLNLTQFTLHPFFADLDLTEQQLLVAQRGAMEAYVSILAMRIQRESQADDGK